MERPYVFLQQLALLIFFEEMANPTVEARGSPLRCPFVFKDEGHVLVFCVPVLFLCLSVPYSVCFDEKA